MPPSPSDDTTADIALQWAVSSLTDMARASDNQTTSVTVGTCGPDAKTLWSGPPLCPSILKGVESLIQHPATASSAIMQRAPNPSVTVWTPLPPTIQGERGTTTGNGYVAASLQDRALTVDGVGCYSITLELVEGQVQASCYFEVYTQERSKGGGTATEEHHKQMSDSIVKEIFGLFDGKPSDATKVYRLVKAGEKLEQAGVQGSSGAAGGGGAGSAPPANAGGPD